MCVVALISSTFYYASLISVPNFFRFVSSCKMVHSSIAFSKRQLHPITALSKVDMCSQIVVLHYSLTSSGVVSCSFNCSSEIFIWKSKVTWPNSSLDCRTEATNFWTFVVSVATSGMCSFGTKLHTYLIVASRLWLHIASSSFSLRSWTFSAKIYSFFILNSLITDSAGCSMIRSSFETPWWSVWWVWRGSVAKFIPMPLIFPS